jgi:hypothetical protein
MAVSGLLYEVITDFLKCAHFCSPANDDFELVILKYL